MRFLDTNILLYSISVSPNEIKKRDVARRLIDERKIGLSVQVLQEFYVQATRTTRAGAMQHEEAVAFIANWMRFPVQEMTLPVLRKALDLKDRHSLSYWDAAVVAAASVLGCNELLSEDMAHGMRIGDVTIRNPFR